MPPGLEWSCGCCGRAAARGQTDAGAAKRASPRGMSSLAAAKSSMERGKVSPKFCEPPCVRLDRNHVNHNVAAVLRFNCAAAFAASRAAMTGEPLFPTESLPEPAQASTKNILFPADFPRSIFRIHVSRYVERMNSSSSVCGLKRPKKRWKRPLVTAPDSPHAGVVVHTRTADSRPFDPAPPARHARRVRAPS